MKAVLLISHGSHSSKTKQEVALMVEDLKIQSGIDIFEYAFLEIEQPDIPAGIDSCIQKGAREVLVLLNFLNSGRHVEKDIPVIVQGAKDKHPHIKISISQPVGQHQGIKNLFLDFIEKSS